MDTKLIRSKIIEINNKIYFTTEEKIKEGDWFIIDNVVRQCIGFNQHYIVTKDISAISPLDCKKIVASTDTSLGLPQPTQAFIKKYVELGGIDEVDLEYEKSDYDDWIKTGEAQPEYKLKVDSNNTITIHAIKDSWNREEIIKLMEKYCIDIHKYTINSTDFNNWIKENL